MGFRSEGSKRTIVDCKFEFLVVLHGEHVDGEPMQSTEVRGGDAVESRLDGQAAREIEDDGV